jgi:hypothetical protein
MIDRYFSLPDDVEFETKLLLITCIPEDMPEKRCPVAPVRFYQRGEARIAIDSVGQIFEKSIERGDASAFPFFTGEEETDRTIAQEGSTDFPYPDKVVTPITPVPTVDRTKRPLIIEYVPSSGPPVERMEAKTDAGSSTKPATGNYLYLPKIGRYYSLPDDVKRVERIDLGTCIPETPCPDFPLLIYQRGEAFIGIDQVGEIFEGVGNGDASAFPFFTGQEETEDK